MNNYEKILELRALDVKRSELSNEMRQFILEKTEAEREFKDGEIVSCFSDNDKYQMDGIIEGAKIPIRLDYHDIMQYAEKESRYQEEFSRIVYGVKKIKKGGTKSSHNVNYRFMPAKKGSYGWYIQKKQP